MINVYDFFVVSKYSWYNYLGDKMKIVNCNDERKKELISVSYNYAFNSLLKFLKNIDIDCEVYDHIFNGKEDYEFTVTIDDLDDKTAQYDSLNHCVIFIK